MLTLVVAFCATCMLLASAAWRPQEYPRTVAASFVTAGVLLVTLEIILRCSAADKDSGFGARDPESHYPAAFVLASSVAVAWVGARLRDWGALGPLTLLFGLGLAGCKALLAMPYPRALPVMVVPQSAVLAFVLGYPHAVAPTSSVSSLTTFCVAAAVALFALDGPLFALLARTGPWVGSSVKYMVVSAQVLALSARSQRASGEEGSGAAEMVARRGAVGTRLRALRAAASFTLLAASVMLLLDPGIGPLRPIVLWLTPRQQRLHAGGSPPSLLSSIQQDPSLLALFFAPALLVGATSVDTSKRRGRQAFLALVCSAGAVLGVYVSEMLLPDELATGDFAQYTAFCWLVHFLYGALFAVYSGVVAVVVVADLRRGDDSGGGSECGRFAAKTAEVALFSHPILTKPPPTSPPRSALRCDLIARPRGLPPARSVLGNDVRPRRRARSAQRTMGRA